MESSSVMLITIFLVIFSILAFLVGLVLFIIQMVRNRQARLDGKLENRSYKLYILATILLCAPIIIFLICTIVSVIIQFL